MSTVPELATRDGSPPPPDLPRGECILTRLDDGTIRIDQADPRILISAELLNAIALGSAIVDGTEALALNAILDTTDCCDCMMQDDYTKAVLKISGVNRTVIYRITEYVPAIHGYIAEWPD